MKILHTGDFHAGKTLAGRDRTPEIKKALAQVLDIAEEEEVDLILVAGDLHDTRNPSAHAEAVVNEFFARAADLGFPVVGIAGNHDSPGRIDALNRLTESGDGHLLGVPRSAEAGGLYGVETINGSVNIARLPFISHRQAISLGEEDSHESYQEKIRRLIGQLIAPMRDDQVNILLAHGTVEGAVLGGSEYVFHSGLDYTINLEGLPEKVQYVAMGHIHKAQGLKRMSARGGYCGSLIPLDFGEAGYEHGVTIIEVEPGLPAYAYERYLSRPLELYEQRITVGELDRGLHKLQDAARDGLLKLVVDVDGPTPGLREKLRREIPEALVIQINQPDSEERQEDRVNPASLALPEAFARYCEPAEGVMQTFRDLYQEVLHEAD